MDRWNSVFFIIKNMSTDDSFVIKDIHNKLEVLISVWDKVK